MDSLYPFAFSSLGSSILALVLGIFGGGIHPSFSFIIPQRRDVSENYRINFGHAMLLLSLVLGNLIRVPYMEAYQVTLSVLFVFFIIYRRWTVIFLISPGNYLIFTTHRIGIILISVWLLFQDVRHLFPTEYQNLIHTFLGSILCALGSIMLISTWTIFNGRYFKTSKEGKKSFPSIFNSTPLGPNTENVDSLLKTLNPLDEKVSSIVIEEFAIAWAVGGSIWASFNENVEEVLIKLIFVIVCLVIGIMYVIFGFKTKTEWKRWVGKK